MIFEVMQSFSFLLQYISDDENILFMIWCFLYVGIYRNVNIISFPLCLLFVQSGESFVINYVGKLIVSTQMHFSPPSITVLELKR